MIFILHHRLPIIILFVLEGLCILGKLYSAQLQAAISGVWICQLDTGKT